MSTETPAEQYARLYDQHYRLRRIQPEDRTPADYQAMTALAGQIAAILAQPPAGYTLPATAQRLIDHAHAHGWQGLTQWYPAPGQDEDAQRFVQVCVGRYCTPAELAAAGYQAARRWQYVLTWHSRDCPPGRLRLFGQGLAETPDRPAVHKAPSITAITAIITAIAGGGEA
jgi:hypothetical protein